MLKLSEGIDRQRVDQLMISRPKTLPSSATVGLVRAAFANDHVHVMLLTDGGTLRGAVIREDLVDVPDDASALAASTLVGRTIAPSASMQQAHQILAETAARRLAVIDENGTLLGLLCLKRRRNGYCSEADLEARRSG